MQDQKLEPLLNLALDAPREDFLRSQSLQTGYNPVTRTWKLIVRHSRDISEVDALGAKRLLACRRFKPAPLRRQEP